jgi:hypothetical protein
MEKEEKESRNQDGRNPSQKLRSQKPDCLVLDTRVSGFPRTDRVRVGFEIYFL